MAAPVQVPSELPDEAAAVAAAKQFSQRVEVSRHRSETVQVFANPDGTLVWEESLTPQRVRRGDGSWAAVDTTLKRDADGSVRPVATVTQVQLSGGGSGPMARISESGRELAVSWPGELPAPVLEGDTAVYREVLSGVDLRVTARVTGFSEILVIKSRAAAANPALTNIRFGLAGTGVTTSDAGNRLEARDAQGRVVFRSPTPTMWDSGDVHAGQASSLKDVPGAARAEGPGVKTAVMAVRLESDSMVVVPDRTILDDPGTQFPVHVDPSWDGGLNGNRWTSVWEKYPEGKFWQDNTAQVDAVTYGGAGSGRTKDCPTCGTYRVRSLFEMALNTPARSQNLLHASLLIQQRHSWTCSPASDARLWVTGAINPDTRWNAQPPWYDDLTAQAPANHSYGKANGCPLDVGDVRFDVTHLVARAFADAWATMTVGLKAIDENTVNHWKRYNALSPKLVIYYNSIPGVGQPTTYGRGCTNSATAAPVLATGYPTLTATVTDPDSETDLKGQFQLLRYTTGAEGLRWYSILTRFDSQTHASGTATQVTADIGTPLPAGVYAWRVRTADPWAFTNPWTGASTSGTDYSAQTGPDFNTADAALPGGWCRFEVDTTAPPVPAITADIYTGGTNTQGSVGLPGQFTFTVSGPTSTDVVGYEWSITDAAGTHPFKSVAAEAVGGRAVVKWTPTLPGQHKVTVRSKDRAQTSTTNATLAFLVGSPTPESGRWLLAEPPGSTTLADSAPVAAPAKHPMTLNGGTLGAPGRIVGAETSVDLNSDAKQTATTAGPVVDITRSFAVAAWVKRGPEPPEAARAAASPEIEPEVTALSQDRANSSGFRLDYNYNDCGCWSFVLTTSDGGTWQDQVIANSEGIGGAMETWTHLTGVYDSAAGVIKLYVNGALVASQTVAIAITPSASTDALVVGRGKFAGVGGQYWRGGVSDVRTWGRMLSASEAYALASPLGENAAHDKSGAWAFEDCVGVPVWCPDSSAYAHDVLALSGGVTQNPAGKAGKALSFDGSGWAEAQDPITGEASPVVRTDQPFTVAAWVSLSDNSTTRIAVGQGGQHNSGLFLGYSKAHNAWTFGFHQADAAGSTASYTVQSSAAPQLNTWTHLVGVYDPAALNVRIYVNGQLAGTAYALGDWSTSGPFVLGRNRVGGAGADYWKGMVDEVQAYAGAVPNNATGHAEVKSKICGC
ncbi:LamG domain-containing protein [Longispora sp. NPDC051575]|uniref:LamG domain-containing protein n=1 Tax=Longispora sp. NPDC051575 TaxID=3154943 RepID=UPI0034359A22